MLPQTVTTPIRSLHTHLLVLQLGVPSPPLGHLGTQLPLLDLLNLRLKHDIVDVIPDEIRDVVRRLLLELGTPLGCQELAKFYH
jgi:hypothetical protein